MEELTDHVGHVGWEDQQEQTQRHRSEVLPQTPAGQTTTWRKDKAISSIWAKTWTFLLHTFSQDICYFTIICGSCKHKISLNVILFLAHRQLLI